MDALLAVAASLEATPLPRNPAGARGVSATNGETRYVGAALTANPLTFAPEDMPPLVSRDHIYDEDDGASDGGEEPGTAAALTKVVAAKVQKTKKARLLLKRTQGFKTAPGPKYPCCYEGCSWTFTRPSHLQKHLYIHTGERPFKCKECDKAFGTNWTLTKHMRIHTGEKPYSCQPCKLSFSQRGSWRRHNFAHHPAVADAIMNGTMTPETAAFKPKSRKAKANCDPYGNFGYGSPLGFSSASQSRPPHVTAAAADNQAQAKGGDDDASTANTLQFVAAC